MEDSDRVQEKGQRGWMGPSEYLSWAPTYPWAEVQSHLGFGLGYSKSDESSQSCHTQGHASNNGHAHQSIWGEEKGDCQELSPNPPGPYLLSSSSQPLLNRCASPLG